ncbi:MAG TPA: hypothetical protein VGE72_13245 [Azospirillum sp.]
MKSNKITLPGNNKTLRRLFAVATVMGVALPLAGVGLAVDGSRNAAHAWGYDEPDTTKKGNCGWGNGGNDGETAGCEQGKGVALPPKKFCQAGALYDGEQPQSYWKDQFEYLPGPLGSDNDADCR